VSLHSTVCSSTIKENITLQMDRIVEDSKLLKLREKELQNSLLLLMVCVLIIGILGSADLGPEK
jgi:hypothetical protein